MRGYDQREERSQGLLCLGYMTTLGSNPWENRSLLRNGFRRICVRYKLTFHNIVPRRTPRSVDNNNNNKMASQTGILPAFITSAGKDTKAPTPVYTPVQPGLIASSADHPVPFTFDNANEGARSDLPTLTEGELDDFVAFLRRLVSGRLPKADVVPLVLNAYNITQEPVNGKNAWSYFYPITYVSYDGKLGNGLDSEDQTNNGGGAGKAKGGKKRKRGDNGEEEEELTLATFRRGTISTPLIRLPDKVLADTYQPWHSIKPGDDGGANNSKKGATGNYRFICFIHSHRLFRESTRRSTAVYTISIWDREVRIFKSYHYRLYIVATCLSPLIKPGDGPSMALLRKIPTTSMRN